MAVGDRRGGSLGGIGLGGILVIIGIIVVVPFSWVVALFLVRIVGVFFERDRAKVRKQVEKHGWRFPIDVASVIGPMESVTEFRVTLPEGWKARLPQNVTANGVFGSYTATYEMNGRELRIVKRMSGGRGIQPPAAIGSLVSWLKEMGKDDARFIVLEPAGA